MLSGLEDALKSNARISLEVYSRPGLDLLDEAGLVEELWNAGRHAEALAALDRLEGSGATVAAMLSWREPLVAPQKLVYPDVRIGARADGVDAALGFDAATGNLFAMIVWDVGWSTNISTDGGASWSETAYWSGVESAVADMAVCGDWAWVGYSSTGDGYTTSRFRRFHVADGSEDSGYGYVQVSDVSPNAITELVVLGNAPDNNDRIYMAYLVDATDSVHFWWDDLSGTSFTDASPAISDAREGLDLAWNPNTAGSYRRWISYVGTDGVIHLWRSSGSSWNAEHTTAFTGVHRRTALSAFADNIYCVFECETEPDKVGICTVSSDDAGVGLWIRDDAYWPTGEEVSGYSPDISVRSGAGRVAVFSSETGDIDDVYYVTRAGWTAGAWSTPVWYNTYDHVSGEDTYVEWVGSTCVATHGLLYFDGGAEHAPYFDLLAPRAFFCDGFEDGLGGAWSTVVP